MKPSIETRTFDRPDEQLNFKEHGQINLVKMSNGTSGMQATLKPGWKWAIDEKPLLGNPESCPMLHTGYCLSGELVIQMPKTGEESRIRKGDFFVVPPQHDAYVPGNQICELILFQAPESNEGHA